jgi:SAM-dependent methyltransferase
MTDGRKDHWQDVYSSKDVDAVSWYQPVPEASIEAVEKFGATPKDSIIDVGGGASTLANELLKRGWHDVSVLDISSEALATAREAIGPKADQVDWIASDITRWSPSRQYDVWHDRAVFHFLTDLADRAIYREVLSKALAPGGLFIIATFALDGPEKCSGLPVQRYDAAGLAKEFGEAFDLVADWRETHHTPFATQQHFTWCAFRKRISIQANSPA